MCNRKRCNFVNNGDKEFFAKFPSGRIVLHLRWRGRLSEREREINSERERGQSIDCERETGRETWRERQRERETVRESMNKIKMERDEEDEKEQRFGTTALTFGAAVGTALLAAWGVSRMSSSSSSSSSDSNAKLQSLDHHHDHHHHHQVDHSQLNYSRDLRGKGQAQRNNVSRTLKILSYNVWFREDVKIYERMEAIGDLIEKHSPDLICFQEVTSNIYNIFQQSDWWKVYRCSVSNEMAYKRRYFCMQLSKVPVKSFTRKPFNNSIMGRELCVTETEQVGKLLVVATSHLESPSPTPPKWDQMYSKERVIQAKEALILLKDSPNVIFGGDMNWDDMLDGQFPLPNGWIDAWVELRPGENGYTYDTKSNKMLFGNRPLQNRLDRFVCKLRDFRICGIDMIGMEAIRDLYYTEEKPKKKLVRPVYPSDHYGLLLTICNK